jgi:DNA-binding beta-propeller fold protein YncE
MNKKQNVNANARHVIASIAKQSLAALAFAGIAAGFVACGDDSSSSVGPNDDEEIASSSSESDVSSSSKNDKSSSSVKKEKSSSSEKTEGDSSSSKKDKSSSSVKEESSSSAEKTSSSSEAKEELKYIGAIFEGDYFAGPEGNLRMIDKDGKLSEATLSFYQDSRVAVNGSYVYVMEGLSVDNITKVNPELISEGAEKAVEWQVSFAYANPVDMAFDGDYAWVALQNADSLVKISTEDGKVVKSIKTGEFANEGETSPYVADVELYNGALYVLMQRYINSYPMVYPKGLLAVYDASTGELKKTIELATKNPQKMTFFKDELYVATLGEYNDHNGTDADNKRGIEKVDLTAKKSQLIISGEKLGAGAYSLTEDNGIAYVAVMKAWGSSPIVKVDLESKKVIEIDGIADAQWSVAYKNGVLYVGDHANSEAKVYVYKDSKLTALETPEGALPTYSIALF